MPGGSKEEILIVAANDLKAAITQNSPSEEINLVASDLADAIKNIGTARKNKRVTHSVTLAPQPLVVSGTSTPDALTPDESIFLDDVIESNRAAAPVTSFPKKDPGSPPKTPTASCYRLNLNQKNLKSNYLDSQKNL
jgi:hypothetical protein